MAFDASEENNARARLIRLRDHIAGLPEERFDMGYWARNGKQSVSPDELHECGTAACLAGWACFLFGVSIPDLPVGLSTPTAARLALGLSLDEAGELFEPCRIAAYDATPAEAARVLDHLIATGQVDWSKAFEDTPAETVAA